MIIIIVITKISKEIHNVVKPSHAHHRRLQKSIWKVWADVDSWHQWDEAVEQCKLSGEFKTGATFTLKPVDGPAVAGVVMDCQPNEVFQT